MATETVTVLFTDLVGSTELLSRLGEETADDLRREHFRLLRAAVSDAGGQEVKNLGDGLMVTFDGVGAGLACAVAMQQAMAARPGSAEPMSIRVGVAAGEAEFEEGDYFGLPVVEAARLCARAEGGDILTTDMVRLLARSRGGFDLELLGDLELKGLDDAVTVHRVRWEPVANDDNPVLPVPSRVASIARSRYVGRGREMEILETALKEAQAGDRRAVLLSGEPGIGKTTLAARFATRASEAGASVLYGRCDEDLFVPYQPWAEALGHLVEQAPLELVRAHVDEYGTVVGRVVPAIWSRTVAQVADARASEETDRPRFFAAAVDLLSRASDGTPLVVLLDDLHWADAGSVDLLRHVLSVNRRLPVLFVGTFRDADVGADDPLAGALAALHREEGVTRLPMRGLDDNELLDFLELVAGHEMEADGVALRDALLAETDGNPFFVGELLRHLAATGAIYQDDDGHWRATDDLRTAGLPVSIREVVGQRVRSLGEETHRVLTLASVIGRDFDLDLLERVAEVDTDHLIDLCDGAVEAQVLRERDRGAGYTFAHALIERTLYDAVSANRRARAHRAIAEALEDITEGEPGPRVGELAYHWAQATRPSDAEKAVNYAGQAGARALASFSPAEALRWFSQALELLHADASAGDRTRADLLVGLGVAQRLLGIPAYRETLLEASWAADRAGDVELLARAALANNRGWQSRTDGTADEERLAVLNRAVAALGDDAPATRARLIALLGAEQIYTKTLDERTALAEEAVALARSSGDALTTAHVLIYAHRAIIGPSTLARRRAWVTEGLDLANELGDPFLRVQALDALMLGALDRADRDEFEELLETKAGILEALPDANLQWAHAFHLAVQAILSGDLATAEELATAALNFGLETGQEDALIIYGAQLLNIRIRQGRIVELLPLVEDAVASRPKLGVYRAVLAFVCAVADDLERCRQLLDAEYAAGFAVPEDTNWTTTHAYWAEAARRAGHADAAEALLGRITPFTDFLATTGVSISPVLAHTIGRLQHFLGRLDEADASYAGALALHERLRCPIFVCTTQAAWAALLAERDRGDDRARARAMAEDARETAARGGYGNVERDATDLLHQLHQLS
jgi:class 3 adenylate cyclase